MGKVWLFGLGFILWAAMLWYCIPHDGHEIEYDLSSRSIVRLANKNIPVNGLAMDGRDATLTGYEGTPQVSEAAAKIVRAVWGVRSVHTNILHRPGAPKPVITKQQATEAAASITKILKLRNVEFYTNSERLTPIGQSTVNEVATVLSEYPGMAVEIAGHTDSVGSPEKNLELSRKRAASVKQHLIDKGISGSSLTDVGFGAANPIASNETSAGRQENRRVEFHTKETK
jgi:outer membrane protein OmpA-like peptidoglycan-associated protein